MRLYTAGTPGGHRSDLTLWQAATVLDETARLKVVREMYRRRFDDDAPSRRSIDQLRGPVGQRVKATYEILARQYGVPWRGRKYDPSSWVAADDINRCISAATSCLHGLAEAAILAAGYSPAIGFLHSGMPRSFVYDVADPWKLKIVVPIAFAIASGKKKRDPTVAPERAVRLACRDEFRKSGLLERIIPEIEAVISAGELAIPKPPESTP